jgi:hypothetical protein
LNLNAVRAGLGSGNPIESRSRPDAKPCKKHVEAFLSSSFCPRRQPTPTPVGKKRKEETGDTEALIDSP